MNVFEAARQANVRKVIYAESSALYGGSKTLPTPETDVVPESFYAISKFSTMYFAEGYSRSFGLKSTALRYSCVYGPRQDYRRPIPPVFSSFIIILLREVKPTIYDTGEKRRDFIDVDDIDDFQEMCMMDDRTTGKVFNLGSGLNYSINEIFEIIASLLGSSEKPAHKPDLPGEAFANLADISLARSLGWEPRVSLKEGLQSSIEFIRNELRRGNIS